MIGFIKKKIALIWAKKQPWFAEYFEGFPVQGNGMKMKSGTMKDTKSFAGYHSSKEGKKYVFAIFQILYTEWFSCFFQGLRLKKIWRDI